MNFSEMFSTVMTIRRVIVIISILAGAGYKVAPMVMHKVDAKPVQPSKSIQPSQPAMATVKATGKPVARAAITTNTVTPAPGNSGCNLGEISLTNHYETCVSLASGKDFIITPKMLDAHNVRLTFAVESRTTSGKTLGMSVTQVVARSGKPLEVAVGDFNFSLTPNVAME